jgi:hypothetical protein
MRNGRDCTNSPPVVLLCTRPTRPHSVHHKRKGTSCLHFVPRDERLECLSENHRRSMDYIDAVCYSDSTNSNILQDEVGKPNSQVRSAQLSHTDPRRTLAAPQRNQM